MITQSYLRSILEYDPKTGIFTWLSRSDVRPCWNTRYAHTRAGSNTNTGYRSIGINGKAELEHRLAWVYIHGDQLPEIIDHKDGDRINNRISNLRAATQGQNLANSTIRSSNTTGFKGVSRKRDKFIALVTKDKRQFSTGRLYKTPEEAHAAYVELASRIHGEFARGA